MAITHSAIYAMHDPDSGLFTIKVATKHGEPQRTVIEITPDLALALRNAIGKAYQGDCPCHRGQVYDLHAAQWRVPA